MTIICENSRILNGRNDNFNGIVLLTVHICRVLANKLFMS